MTRKIFQRAWPALMALALSSYEGCIVRSPVHPVAVRLNTSAAEAIRSGQLEKARAKLLVALEYNPCYPSALHNLALAEFMSGALDKAEQLEQKALDCQQDLVQAINGLGVIFQTRGDLELAQLWFEHALEVDPGCLDARKNLVITMQMEGKLEEARQEVLRLKVLEAKK